MISSCKICGSKFKYFDNLIRFKLKNICKICSQVERDVKNGFIDLAIESARMRAKYSGKQISKRLTLKEKEQLLKSCIKKGIFKDVLKAVQLCNRQLSKDEIAVLMVNCIRNGNLQDMQKTADLRKQDLSEIEVENLIKVLIHKGEIDKALEASYLGVKGQTLDNLIKGTIKEGNIHKLMKVVELREFPITEKESNMLVMNHINNGNIEQTFEAAKFRGIALSSEERHRLTQKFIERKWHYCGSELLEVENTALAKKYAMFSNNPSYLNDTISAASHAKKDSIGSIIEIMAKEVFNDVTDKSTNG